MKVGSKCALFLLAWVVFPHVARAQAVLEWSAPVGCPDAAAVQRAVEHAAGSMGRGRVRVEAEVEPIASGYALTLVVQTATGASRERLVADDCALFVRLIAVKVSLLATEAEPAVSAVAAAPAVPVAAAPAVPVAAAQVAANGGEHHDAVPAWSIRAQGLVATTPVPSPAFGIALGAGYRIGAFRLELLASYLFPRERSFPERSEAGGSFQAWSAGLRACGVSPWPRAADVLELAGCGGIEAGFLRGRGFGVEPANTSEQPFVTVSAGLSVAVPLGPLFAVRADVDALLGLVRPDFFVRNLGVLHRVASIGMRGMLGLELRWP